ncbi:MAG TPA: methyltransferase [Methylomirabilota bacterium]|nr:methyltransferase [Methylomirabilota bacterium]
MTKLQTRSAGEAVISQRVRAFYERHPYPPPADDLSKDRKLWDEQRRRAESHLLWPAEPYRDDRSVLVAGCGTSQAAKYAMRWPNAKVTGIDVSGEAIAFTQALKRKYGLDNLQLRQLAVERTAELGEAFEHVVCTGVLHHLPDPDAGLRALREVMTPAGALNLMVYAPYGRAGVYLMQDYCRRLGIRPTTGEVADLVASLQALPADHPLVPLLSRSPDFRTGAGIADALLHPQDRSYSVPELFGFLSDGGLSFSRWVRQAPYLPQCGALAASPHRRRLERLPAEAQYAAVELFRGTMVRHSLVAHRSDRAPSATVLDFEGDAWPGYIPVRMPDAIEVRERLPPGAEAVLINRSHTCNDLYLPIDAKQAATLAAVDGRRAIAAIAAQGSDQGAAREFFRLLWSWDQVVFDTSNCIAAAQPTTQNQ